MLIRTNTGARIDLEHYSGFKIINYTFEILDDYGNEYIFPSGTSVHFKLYAKKNGKLLADITMGIDSPISNFIYLNDNSQITSQRSPRTMWHEITSNEQGIEKLLLQGVSTLL